jgi:large subunit ribosomal protein L23
MNGIKCFITSKKALSLIDEKKYSFLVHRWMKKDTLKNIIEDFFNVKVIRVNTFNLPRKKRRLGKFRGYKSQYKKAIVTLDSADTLQLFSDI